METLNDINMAIVGCGVHSHVHATVLRSFQQIKVVACCDVDFSRAKKWSEKYNCSPYSEIAEMINKEKIDAVILCTWPNLHLEQIKTCLALGIKNILCEKSLTINKAAADEIWQLTRKHSAFLMEGCMYRFHPAIKKVEDLVFSSDLGQIDSIRSVFSNYEPFAHKDQLNSLDWRYQKECGGGVPHDWMSYCVNAANHFSGSRPVRVFASGNVNPEYKVIDRLYGQIIYENGIIGIIESSKHANFSQMLHIACAGGIVQLPIAWGIQGDITIYKHHRKEKWDYILTDEYKIEEANPYIEQMENFLDVINGKAAPGIPLKDSIINCYTIEALVDSLNENTVIDIDLRGIS